MDIDFQTIEKHIPYYLTQEQKKILAKDLCDFNKRNIAYYINKYPNEMLQGDGWKGLEVINTSDGTRKNIMGIILSNTCDISPDNKRDIPTNIVFAPIIKLKNYAALLQKNAFTNNQIENKFKAIREQKITTMFYLPENETLNDEYVALLDDIHSVPAHSLTDKNNQKLFTLSQTGFYLFLFKLSVHFCRFHENLSRYD
ncbi:MAG: hypothetical protein H7839_06225 [Magnetococcus sp. YQC-5]